MTAENGVELPDHGGQHPASMRPRPMTAENFSVETDSVFACLLQ